MVQIADDLAVGYTSWGVGGVESDVISLGEAGLSEGPDRVGHEPKIDVGLRSPWGTEESGGPDGCGEGAGCVGCV